MSHCLYLGHPTGDLVQCQPCSDKMKKPTALKVHGCAIRDRCILSRHKPDVEGIEACGKCEAKRPDIPIYCLTLRQTTERTKQAGAHFRAIGLHCEFIHGIHGASFFPRNDCLRPGYIGNILSHLMLWEDLLRRRVPEALILEDDAEFEPDFLQRLGEQLAGREELQFAFVGWVQAEKERRGTHAYLVRASALPVLIETNQVALEPLDVQLQRRSLPRLKWDWFTASLARQRNWISTCAE